MPKCSLGRATSQGIPASYEKFKLATFFRAFVRMWENKCVYLFGKDINVFDGYMSFVDPETGDEVCRYDLNYNADNVLGRDFFDESNWEMLDGAEFVAGEFGRGNGEPYRQWSFTVTDEYIQ